MLRKSLLPILLAVPTLAGCGSSGPSSGAAADATPLVKVVRPNQTRFRWSIEQPGNIQAFETTPIAAKLPARIRAIAPDLTAIKARGQNPTSKGEEPVIDIGSVVARDQPLAFLDIPELAEEAGTKRAAAEQAEAELEQSRKELAVSVAQVAAARAGEEEARASVKKTKADLARWQAELAQSDDLVARKVIDTQSREAIAQQVQSASAAAAEADARVNTALALTQEREARRARASAEINTAATKVKVARAEVRRLEALLSYTVVTAPFAGVVTARFVHTGHLLQPAMNGPAQILFTVARIDVVRVFAEIPETSAAGAGAGTRAVVRIPALANRDLEAKITRTAHVIQPETRALRVEIDLDNPDGSLKPGMYAYVTIPVEAPNAVVLPTSCLLAADETQYAYLVEDGKAVKYRVDVGRTDAGMVQVLGRRKAGTTAGSWQPFTPTDRVVSGNLGALADGMAVRVE